eukprot:245274_1
MSAKSSSVTNNEQQLISMLNYLHNGNTEQIRQSQHQLEQMDTNSEFLSIIVKYICINNSKHNSNIRLQAAILLNKIIRSKWKHIHQNNKQFIKNHVVKQFLIEQTNCIYIELLEIINFIISTDFPKNWNNLLQQISNGINTN